MTSGSEASMYGEPIPKIDTTLVLTKNEATIHIEHFFDVPALEGIGLSLNETMLYCGIRGFYNDYQTIHPKLIRMFLCKAYFKTAYAKVSTILSKTMTLSMESITQVIGCMREGNIYNNNWEKNYEEHVPRKKWCIIYYVIKQRFGKMFATKAYCIK